MTIEALLPGGPGEHLTMHPDEPVSVAVDYFNQEKRGLIVVADDDKRILGVVSTADIIRALGRFQADTLTTAVQEIMTPSVATCGTKDSLDATLHVMNDRNIHHLPVVDEHGDIRGVISIRDVLRALLDQSRLNMEQLRNYFLKMGGRY